MIRHTDTCTLTEDQLAFRVARATNRRIIVNQDTIIKAFSDLGEARRLMYQATEATRSAKADYETKSATALASGIIEGKNAELRKAAADTMFATEAETVRQAITAQDIAELNLRLALDQVDMLKLLNPWFISVA